MNVAGSCRVAALPALLVVAQTAVAGSPVQSKRELASAKPVPRVQVVPLPGRQASIQHRGIEWSRYHFAADQRRPFLYPINGPGGRSLTRMGHPHDPEGHSHHNSVWISHHDVAGVDFWSDRGTGVIVHKRIVAYQDSDDGAALVADNQWTTGGGTVLLDERRRIEVRPLAGGEWFMTIDVRLRAVEKTVTLGKTPFGLVGVRMAKTIGVRDGGGTIRNSAGGVNEKGVFWKPAKWVDYSGPIAEGTVEGITLMDHPSNPNHPTHFHVRDDGWMGASLTHTTPREIPAEKPLVLRYGLLIHRGVPGVEQLDRRHAEFAKRAIVDLENIKR
jgi:hypothetical protein